MTSVWLQARDFCPLIYAVICTLTQPGSQQGVMGRLTELAECVVHACFFSVLLPSGQLQHSDKDSLKRSEIVALDVWCHYVRSGMPTSNHRHEKRSFEQVLLKASVN